MSVTRPPKSKTLIRSFPASGSLDPCRARSAPSTGSLPGNHHLGWSTWDLADAATAAFLSQQVPTNGDRRRLLIRAITSPLGGHRCSEIEEGTPRFPVGGMAVADLRYPAAKSKS